MKFRPQRGGYDESMAEVVEVSSTSELIDLLTLQFGCGDYAILSPHEPEIDSRNGWDTHTVTKDGEAYGFTDGPAND